MNDSIPDSNHAPRGSGAAFWRMAALFSGVVVLLGLLESGQGRILLAHVPAHQYWPEALLRVMPSWLLLAALVPAVMAFASRLRLDGPHRVAAWTGHALGCVAFVGVQLAGGALLAALRHDVPSEFPRYLQQSLYRSAVATLVVYWALAGVMHMVWHQAEARERAVAESRLRAQLAEARLAALRAQLNPHFLFNTLNAISTLALRGDRERLLGALDALSALLRATLEDGRTPWKSMADELHVVDRYLEIQSLRFGDRMQVEREVDSSALDAIVPGLLLQPIVENAIEHGVAARPGPCRVTMRAARVDLTLVIEVSDTGPGFGAAASSRAGVGLGLANTRARLEQLFGGRASLETENGPAGGACVRVRLPWLKSRAEAESLREGAAG